MRRLLWIGDAGVDTGFARCTHKTLDVLKNSWDVTVLGVNYRGDPHDYPYPIYPCFPGGDMFGLGRVAEILQKVGPDVVVVQNDPWNLPAYMRRLANVPVIAALAVDGKNCAGRGLNGLALAIFWTKFAMQEARLGGYTGPAAVVPLGVDLDIYRPLDRAEARKIVGLPSRVHDAFIVGNVNRNQPRKRLDLTIAYFAEWVKRYRRADAYLFLQVAPTGDSGYDCQQLASYFGVANRIILAQPAVFHGVSEEALAAVYSCFDVQFTTTQGEGWGLTTMEGMAAGIPQIVPDWSALGEWTEDAAIKVPCSSIACTPNNINVIGGIMDREGAIGALERAYVDVDLRAACRERGLALVARDCYRWPAIGAAFAAAVSKALDERAMRVEYEKAMVV